MPICLQDEGHGVEAQTGLDSELSASSLTLLQPEETGPLHNRSVFGNGSMPVPVWLADDQVSLNSAASSEADVCESIHNQVICLMDLLPSLEDSLIRIESASYTKNLSPPSFAVSEPARAWVQLISDKFAKADKLLVERLGECNFQRYIDVNARMHQVANSKDASQAGNTSKVDRAELLSANHCPQSAVQESLRDVYAKASRELYEKHRSNSASFHDSGIGTSMAASSSPAGFEGSIASHASFQSSLAEAGDAFLTVPPTPEEVGLGKPFRCDICGRCCRMRTRIDWKRHVFDDLKPYVCTFVSSHKGLIKFNTRAQWAEHEFNEHRVVRSWCCGKCPYKGKNRQDMNEHLLMQHENTISSMVMPALLQATEVKVPIPVEEQFCPLCMEYPGKTRRQFTTHLARHLEAIALAVLPKMSLMMTTKA